MGPACPDLEQLDQFIGDRSSLSSPLRDHISSCADCRARLAELSENRALFAELGSSGAELGSLFGPPAPPPRQIGEFDILREIGRGGMGVVYEARQRHPARRVALKVVRGDPAASPERRRLFEREIRALARLRHVGIALIFDSGTSGDDPFYAMEFVQGAPLIEHARRHNLDLRGRLAMFLKLCAAISYAHQRGVIHRDLKPGNVLVEDDGTLKVLDFGLARITDADVSAASLEMDGGRLAGTVAYMSPEQTRGVPDGIDLRSDVYSLGVILFELLTGTLPYEVSRTSVVAAVRSICESPPRRPSSIAGRSGRLLAGDIETIVLKALEKSPDRRYQSVAALADDVERYLTNQPIVARPPGTIYQLKKFAQRNRVLVGGVIAVFVALGLGIVSTTSQARRARIAEKQARAEAAVSAEITRFLTTMFAAVAPEADGNDVRVVDILKRAAADIKHTFTDQPDVAVALREVIGNAFRKLTLYAEAEPQFRAGLELARTVYGEQSREALRFRYFLAESDTHLDRADKAEPELRAILAAQAERFGPDDPDTMTTRHFLGVLTAELGHMDEAESLLRENLDARRRALGPEHEDTLYSMANLAAVLRRLDRREQSAVLLKNAYETARRTRGPDHAQTLFLQTRMIEMAWTPAELAAVEPAYREIIQRGSRLFGPDHQQTLHWMEGLARLLKRICKYGEADEVARDLYERRSRRLGPHHPETIDALKLFAGLARADRQWEEAEALARRLLDLHVELYGETDPQTLGMMHDLANVLRDSGQLNEALQIATRTLELHERSDSDPKSAAVTRTLLAEILRKLDRMDEGRAAAEAALNVLRSVCPPNSVYIAWAECHLGSCLRDQHRFAEAEPLLLRSHRQFLATLGDCHPQTRDADTRIVELYRLWNESDPDANHDRPPAD